jgi:hypothetical protein
MALLNVDDVWVEAMDLPDETPHQLQLPEWLTQTRLYEGHETNRLIERPVVKVSLVLGQQEADLGMSR